MEVQTVVEALVGEVDEVVCDMIQGVEAEVRFYFSE
jgi:hypothetical protein